MVSRYGISVAIVRALVIGGLLWGALWWALHHSVATAVSGDAVSGDAAPAIAASTILAEDSADGGTLPMPQSGMATNLTSPAGIESSHLYSYTYGSWFALEAATTIYDMAVDAAGNLYFVGVTRATSMPGFSTEPWECAQPGNNEVGFIASFTAQGTPRYGDFLGTCYSEMTSIVLPQYVLNWAAQIQVPTVCSPRAWNGDNLNHGVDYSKLPSCLVIDPGLIR